MKQTQKKIFGVLLLAIAIINLPMILFAQGLQVKGKVIDATTQKPIEGVTVTEKGSTNMTATNGDGEFTINTQKGKTLVVSFIGYETKTSVVGSKSVLNFSLFSANKDLGEVVVTATGIKKEAKRLGYAVQTIDASTLTQAREADPVNSLKGAVAGLNININSELAHSPDVIIRGENSSDNRPLFVVDGVSISSDTYNINPDDIETVTVLKGPSAAALYGFQGKNGAIIINTKKGTKNKRGFSLDFNSSTQLNKGFIALPKYQDTYGPGDNGQYAYGGGGSSPQSYFGSGAIGIGNNDYDYDVWGPQFRGQLLPQYDGAYDPTKTYTTTFADGSKYTGHVAPTPWVARGKDNLKRFLQTGLLSSNSVSISASTEKTDVRFSLGNTYQKGIVPNTQMNNANFTGSIVHRFNDQLTFSSYFNYSRQTSPNLPDVNYGPNSIIYNIIIWGGADWDINAPNIRNYWQPGKVGVQQNYEEYYRYNNPWFMSYEWLRSHNQNNEYGYLSLNYKPVKGLEFQLRPSITAYDMFNSEKMPYSAGAYGRPLRQGDYREDRRSLFESNVDAQVKYNQNKFLGVLDLSALAGGNVRTFNFNSNFESTNYLNVPGIYSFSNSQGTLTGSSYQSGMKVVSAYYSVDLGFKKYATLSTTGRVDKSSSLPANGDTYFYPSFNLATVVSDYVTLPKVISFLKFRGSIAESKSGGTSAFFSPNVSATPASQYGYTWNSPYGGPNYQFSSAYNLNPTYSSQYSAEYTTQTVNPNIQTSDRKSTEIGADIRFLNNKLGFDITHYHYKNTGIVNKGTSPSTGFSSYLTNGNEYTNDGWEVTMTASPVKNVKGFSWNVITNFSTYIRKWTNIATPDNYEKNGERIDLVYGNAFVRTPDGKMVIDAGSGVYTRFSDLGSSAKKVYGHSDPDWTWAAINTVSYKAFALRFQFDGQVGGVIEDYVRKKTLQGGRHIESASGAFAVARPSDEANIAAYTGEGVNLSGPNGIKLDPITGQISNWKELTATVNTTKSQVQPFVTRMASVPDLDIVKKTYVKLREVALTYNLPDNILGKQSFIKKASVSFVGRNLLYFFPNKFKDLDVDQYSQNGGSGLQTPTTRNYGFNVNLNF